MSLTRLPVTPVYCTPDDIPALGTRHRKTLHVGHTDVRAAQQSLSGIKCNRALVVSSMLPLTQYGSEQRRTHHIRLLLRPTENANPAAPELRDVSPEVRVAQVSTLHLPPPLA